MCVWELTNCLGDDNTSSLMHTSSTPTGYHIEIVHSLCMRFI